MFDKIFFLLLSFNGNNQYCIVTSIRTSLQQISCACSMKCKMHGVELKAFVWPQDRLCQSELDTFSFGLWLHGRWCSAESESWRWGTAAVSNLPDPLVLAQGYGRARAAHQRMGLAHPGFVMLLRNILGPVTVDSKGNTCVSPLFLISTFTMIYHGLGWCLWPRSSDFNQVMVTCYPHPSMIKFHS